MKITLISYAQMTDYLDEKTEWEFSEDSITIEKLRNFLAEKLPKAKDLLPSLRFAVHDEFVQDDFILKDGMEVDVIPPSSGG